MMPSWAHNNCTQDQEVLASVHTLSRPLITICSPVAWLTTDNAGSSAGCSRCECRCKDCRCLLTDRPCLLTDRPSLCAAAAAARRADAGAENCLVSAVAASAAWISLCSAAQEGHLQTHDGGSSTAATGVWCLVLKSRGMQHAMRALKQSAPLHDLCIRKQKLSNTLSCCRQACQGLKRQ